MSVVDSLHAYLYRFHSRPPQKKLSFEGEDGDEDKEKWKKVTTLRRGSDGLCCPLYTSFQRNGMCSRSR